MNKLRVIKEMNLAVVTAIDEFNPLQHLKTLTSELSKEKFRGKVVFDLLLFNGLSDNRFIQFDFNGTDFDRSSFKALHESSFELKNEQNQFFKSNLHILKRSVLSSSELRCF
jgi:hypothetical protein